MLPCAVRTWAFGQVLEVALTNQAGDPTWLSRLIAGQPITPDVQVLRTLSNALQVTPADFVSSGVRHAMLSEDVA